MAYELRNATTNALILTLDNPQKESRDKEAGNFKTPLPRTDSSQAIVIDMFGVEGTFNIPCKFVGTAVADLASKVTTLEALVNGTQSTIKLVSDLAGTKYVKVQRMHWDWDAGSPLILNYALDFIESQQGV